MHRPQLVAKNLCQHIQCMFSFVFSFVSANDMMQGFCRLLWRDNIGFMTYWEEYYAERAAEINVMELCGFLGDNKPEEAPVMTS